MMKAATVEDGDRIVRALCGALTAVALARRASSTCPACGCLLRPLEPCPACRPEAWRRPVERPARGPWGVTVPRVSPAEQASRRQSERQIAARRKNFARTA